MNTKEKREEEILEAAIGQFYQEISPSNEIILSHKIPNLKILQQALNTKITVPLRGQKHSLTQLAIDNAKSALKRHLSEHTSNSDNLNSLQKEFNLPTPINHIEIFDNSHISGTNAVGAMVVFERELGWAKNRYRNFNIKSTKVGDDLAMMYEVLTRRFKKATNLPDLIIIDGGKNQLNSAHQVLQDLAIDIPIIAIAKGVERNAGKEEYHMLNKEPLRLYQTPLAYFMQLLRDESHRFAIGTHRKKRSKAMLTNSLDNIGGVGSTRKKSLLDYFGSIDRIKNASVKEISKVQNINNKLAQKIFDFYH